MGNGCETGPRQRDLGVGGCYVATTCDKLVQWPVYLCFLAQLVLKKSVPVLPADSETAGDDPGPSDTAYPP